MALNVESIRKRTICEFKQGNEWGEVEMVSPRAAEATQIRTELAKLHSGNSGPEDDVLGQSFAIIAEALKVCIPDDQIEGGELTTDDWIDLIVKTGGLESPLVVTCLGLCGLNLNAVKGGELDHFDHGPT